MKRFKVSLALICGIFIALSVNTAAYLDPSAMTYMVQAIAMVVVASGAAIAIFWKRIRLFFKKKKQGKRFKDNNEHQDNDPVEK